MLRAECGVRVAVQEELAHLPRQGPASTLGDLGEFRCAGLAPCSQRLEDTQAHLE